MPVDGSQQSLRALDYAANIYRSSSSSSSSYDRVLITILDVIEWADEDEESMDDELASAMEEQERQMLRSIMIPHRARDYERMVKLGDPLQK